MERNYNVNPADRASGVIAYLSRITECHECGRPTNLLFQTSRANVPACSRECAAAFESGEGAE